jgi:L-rhamnose mutarotase
MKRAAFTFKIRPDKIPEYKEHHKAVWPEMLAALTRNGWHNYTLFIKPNGEVYGYVETPQGLGPANAGMQTEDINAQWQEMMAPFVPDGVKPDQNFLELEEYFHLD